MIRCTIFTCCTIKQVKKPTEAHWRRNPRHRPEDHRDTSFHTRFQKMWKPSFLPLWKKKRIGCLTLWDLWSSSFLSCLREFKDLSFSCSISFSWFSSCWTRSCKTATWSLKRFQHEQKPHMKTTHSAISFSLVC